MLNHIMRRRFNDVLNACVFPRFGRETLNTLGVSVGCRQKIGPTCGATKRNQKYKTQPDDCFEEIATEMRFII